MSKLWVTASTESYFTCEPDLDDSWDQGESELNVELQGISLTKPSSETYYWGSLFDIDTKHDFNEGEIDYIVGVNYRTGSTFGSSGAYDVLDAFQSYAEARDLREFIEREATNYSFEFKGKKYYASWVGYFESLNHVDICEFEVHA